MALNAAVKRIGRLAPASSVLFVCDIQGIFRESIYQLPTVIHGTNSLISASKILDIPIVVTTQYASRFGPTVPEITDNLKDAKDVKEFDKTLFSMLTTEVETHLTTALPERKSVLLCGIEGHVCVLQTCLDLLEKGYDVHVISDAVSSSSAYNRSMSLERMRQSGAFITSVESSIFQLAKDSKDPRFKSISKLIKEHLKSQNGFDTSAARL